MTVETLTAAHLGEVAELEKACFADPWSEKALELLISDGAYGVVCLVDGRVVAYGGILWAPDEGQITNIATHPDFRRMGYGRAIVESLIKYAKNNNLDSISLEVRESNRAAIELYSSLGFKIEGKRKDFYKKPTEAALVMVLRTK